MFLLKLLLATTVCILTGCSTDTSSIPFLPGTQPQVVDGSIDQKGKVLKLWNESRIALAQAKKSVEANDTRCQTMMPRYFGNNNPSARAKVLGDLNKMIRKSTGEKYTLTLFGKTPDIFDGHMGVAGYTTYENKAAIHINTTQLTSKSFTRVIMLHELSHNACHTDDHGYVNLMGYSGFDGRVQQREVYVKDGKVTALSQEQLLDNADSYAHFINTYSKK